MTDRTDTVDSTERGQVIVVAALVVAVLFVGMALVLNGAIYAENTATRDTESEDRISLEQRQQIEEQLGETIDETNENVTSENNAEVADELKDAIENQSDTRSDDEAQRGTDLVVETTSVSDGPRLRQSNISDFTPKDDSTGDWTLTEGVPNGGQFAMNIQREDVFGATLDTTMALLADSAFGIEFALDDDAHSLDTDNYAHPIAYRIYIFGGTITDSTYAVVEHPDQEFEIGDESLNYTNRTNANHITAGWLNQSCSLEGDNVSLKLGEKAFGGSHCEPFSFYSEDLGAHAVNFTNTYTHGRPRATGTYDIMVNSTDYNDSAFYDYGDGEPFAQSAVYGINYALEYRADGTTYTIENNSVEPRDRDPGGILWEHPRVDRFDVTRHNATAGGSNYTVDWNGVELNRTFSTAGGSNYTVDWRVFDPNGELDHATVRLIERDSLEAGAENELNKTVLNASLEAHVGGGDLTEPINDSVEQDAGLIEKDSVLSSLCSQEYWDSVLNLLPIDCSDFDVAENIIYDNTTSNPLDTRPEANFDAYVRAYLNVYGRIDTYANVDDPLNDDWTVDEQEYDISGVEATGNVTLGPSRNDDFTDLVQIRVENDAGHSTVETVRCEPNNGTCERLG